MLKQLRKESGFTIIELLIVIAIIGILATLVLTNFQGAQAKGRDTVRKNDINSLYQKLEEYYNEKGGYPNGNISTTVLPGIDTGALIDADGRAIGYTNGFVVATIAPTITVNNDNEYVYVAYGCTTAGAQATVAATCTKYSLGAFLEKEATYTKSSLN